METSSLSTAGNETITVSLPAGFLRGPYTTTVSFALAVLLFFLPFAHIKCNDTKLASNSGIGIAFGTAWKNEMFGKNDLFGNKADVNEKKEKPIQKGPNGFALAALAAGVAGLGLSLSRFKLKSVFSFSLGLLGVLMLLALLIQLKSQLKGETGKESDMNIRLTVSFTFGYFLSVIAFAAAAFFGYKQHKREENKAVNDWEIQQLPGNNSPDGNTEEPQGLS